MSVAAGTLKGARMHWVIVVLTIMISLANLGDFIFGEKGNRQLLSKLSSYYVAVGGDWKATYQVPARKMNEFLIHIFGHNFFLYLFKVAIYSVSLVFILSALSYITYRPPPHTPSVLPRITPLDYAPCFAVGNCLGDLLSWSIVRFLLFQMKIARLIWAIVLFMIGMASAIIFSFASFFIGILLVLTFDAKAIFFGPGQAAFNGYLFLVPLLAGLPSIVFVLTTASGILLVVLRPIIRAPLMGLLERLESAPKSILTLTAVALSGFVGIVAALAK
jgi:hypothetical protein